jgi:hypothetical protein
MAPISIGVGRNTILKKDTRVPRNGTLHWEQFGHAVLRSDKEVPAG